MAERRLSRRNRSQTRTSRPGSLLAVAADVICHEFRDDDPERTLKVIFHMWWNTGLREQRFVEVVQAVRAITKKRIAAGQVQLGDPGRRRAMPYFLAVLREQAALAQTLALKDPNGQRQRDREAHR
jgi:hypothetical protein